jgi:hypothetical protein
LASPNDTELSPNWHWFSPNTIDFAGKNIFRIFETPQNLSELPNLNYHQPVFINVRQSHS